MEIELELEFEVEFYDDGEPEADWDDDEYLELGFNPYEGCYDWDC